jgi:hypothetical protein
MAMMRSHFSERAKAITLPPAPAKMSIRVVWDGLLAERSLAICLGGGGVSSLQGSEEMGRGGGGSYVATGSGVTPNQASSVRRMS